MQGDDGVAVAQIVQPDVWQTGRSNAKGKKIASNRDLKLGLDQNVRQDSIVLVNELIESSSFSGKEDAKHMHDWLDNNGKNQWDVWHVFMQEKMEPTGKLP